MATITELSYSSSCSNIFMVKFFFKILFIFKESRREGEREGKKHQCVVASCMSPTGDLARNPGMCPDWESNWRPFGSQASIQSTEPHQPGHHGQMFWYNSWRYEKMQNRTKQVANHCSSSYCLYKWPQVSHYLLDSCLHPFNSEPLLKRTLCSPDS